MTEPEVKFGRYTIIEPLAKGGMAQIFRAKTQAGRIFTLKKILKDFSENTDFIQMFLQEAKISLNLKDPHVVRVLDFGQIDGTYFLAMEYVFGRDVSALLKKCAEDRKFIPFDVVAHIVSQCCLGLEYAHNLSDSFGAPLGIVHRDISPPNILVSYNGEAKILDFGIAKAVSSGRKEDTRSGVLKGKFSYMSPEQASGKPIDRQSDLFSLGTVFYELLTTRNLFYLPDEIETLERVRKADVPPPRKIRKDLPSDLEAIVLKALELKPRNRYKSCGEMAAALNDYLQKNFPRNDARVVAKFVRTVFASDFQKRREGAKAEGWRDILEIGRADDVLMLDQTPQENLLFRPARQSTGHHELTWLHRLLHDPRIKQQFRRNVLRLVLVSVLAVSIFAVYHLLSDTKIKKWAARVLDMEQRQQETESPLNSNPTDSETSSDRPPAGSFQYLVENARELETHGDLDGALKAYKRALDLNPFDVELLVKKHFLMLSKGEVFESCRWFQSNPSIPSADKLLSDAVCLEFLGDKQRSLSSYSEFINRHPQDARVEKVRSLIQTLRRKWKY